MFLLTDKMPFKWQINASAVGKLLGFFGKDRQHQAIAETWHMNLKRMPRFGVRPSVLPTRPTVQQVVETEIATTAEYVTQVESGIKRSISQTQAVDNMHKIATKKASKLAVDAQNAQRAVKKARKIYIVHQYPTIKSGLKTKIGGFFAVKNKIYHKKSTKTAKLSTLAAAAAKGWKPKIMAVEQTKKAEITAKVTATRAAVAQKVQRHIVKTAQKQINTLRGTRKEATDLELVQQKYPGVVGANNQAKFLKISKGIGQFGAFVIGKIDGFDKTTDTIYELKHRQSRLFHELRRYEQVQCLLYLKMFQKSRLMLVETYCGKQVYYPMQLADNQLYHNGQATIHWNTIITGLEDIVKLLNKAETDSEYRSILMQKIF